MHMTGDRCLASHIAKTSRVARTLHRLAVGCLLLGGLSACGNAYRSPPPEPPPDLMVLYGVDPEFKSLYTLDTRLGVHTLVGSPGPGRLDAPGAMAIRPDDSEIFVYNNAVSSEVRQYWGLANLDRCTGFATRIGPSEQPRLSVDALAFSAEGQLYAFGHRSGESDGPGSLYTIDPTNGVYAVIGEVKASAHYRVTAADFHSDGDLYGIGALVSNLDSTLDSTLVGTLVSTPSSSALSGTPASGPGGTREGEIQLLLIIDPATGQPSIVGEISPEIGSISAIAFKPSGKLLAAGAYRNGGKILFEIDIATGAIADVRRATVAARGMGYARPLRC